MATGMWTAVSGAKAREAIVDTIAHNLANSDTVGFKKDLNVFKEYISTLEREHDRPVAKFGRITDQDLNPVNDKDQSHVVTQGTYTNFSQGPIKVTKGALDVAIEGPGLIEVSTPQGLRFTRNGQFKMGQDGRLVTSEGYPVLSEGPREGTNTELDGRNPAAVGANPTAETVASRFINLRDRGDVSISESGEIYSDGNLVAKLSVVEFQNPNLIRKQGGQLFSNIDPSKNPEKNAQASNIHQYMLEASNVNPIQEMSELIRAHRLFEQDMKNLKTYGELLGKEANDIGRR
ncbi:MAG: flagellar hook-basal body protein, partial [Proteobacteria bacterium]